MTPILDSLPSDITIDWNYIFLSITKEITGTYSGWYMLDLDVPLGFYLNSYETIEELAQAIKERLELVKKDV